MTFKKIGTKLALIYIIATNSAPQLPELLTPPNRDEIIKKERTVLETLPQYGLSFAHQNKIYSVSIRELLGGEPDIVVSIKREYWGSIKAGVQEIIFENHNGLDGIVDQVFIMDQSHISCLNGDLEHGSISNGTHKVKINSTNTQEIHYAYEHALTNIINMATRRPYN